MIRLGRPAPRAKDHDDKLVPMINVIFLLLMFFLIVGNLKPLFSEEQRIPLSRSEALRAQEYLRHRGVTADLVILNERAASYAQDMQHTLDYLCENLRMRGQSDGVRQHVFTVRRDLMEVSTWQALLATARAVFHARNGTLADQIARTVSLYSTPRGDDETKVETPVAKLPAPVAEPVAIDGEGLTFWNGFGGFNADRREYAVRLRGGEATPQPWINVIANREFGFHASAEAFLCAESEFRSNNHRLELTVFKPVEAVKAH